LNTPFSTFTAGLRFRICTNICLTLWFEYGTTKSEMKKVIRKRIVEKNVSLKINLYVFIPRDFNAIISKSEDILPKVIIVATRTDMGIDKKIMKGRLKRKSFKTIKNGKPFPMIRLTSSKILLTSRTKMIKKRARKKEGMNSFIIVLSIIFITNIIT